MATSYPSAGTSSQSTLSDWAGPYVTGMLGKTQAISEQPYSVYQGPMTAGESGLQNKVFQGLGSLNFPSQLGKSFSSSGAYQPPAMTPNTYANQPIGTGAGAPPQPMPDYASMGMTGLASRTAPTETDWQRTLEMAQFAPGTDMVKAKADFMSGGGKNLGGPEMGAYNPAGSMQSQIDFSKPFIDSPQGGITSLTLPQGSQQPNNIAQSYMNPYLQSVLQPQLEELRRQSQMNMQPGMAKLTQAGGYGGGRQAIMESEANRNLLQAQNQAIGTGYASAYDKAMQQFNTEQGQAKTLADMMSGAGAQQRGIEQEGISADYNEFLAQRDYPQKMLQFQQSMLQGLPISTVSTSPASQTGLGSLQSTVGTLGSTYDLLKKLKVIE